MGAVGYSESLVAIYQATGRFPPPQVPVIFLAPVMRLKYHSVIFETLTALFPLAFYRNEVRIECWTVGNAL